MINTGIKFELGEDKKYTYYFEADDGTKLQAIEKDITDYIMNRYVGNVTIDDIFKVKPVLDFNEECKIGDTVVDLETGSEYFNLYYDTLTNLKKMRRIQDDISDRV